MSDEYYDKDGTPISNTLAWAKKLDDPEYKRIDSTVLPNGIWVSTVWLGLNHSYGDGPPMIFESMAFSKEKKKVQIGDKEREFREELDCERYSTLEEAKAGHKRMVQKFMEPTAEKSS